VITSLHGDCRDILQTLDERSVQAIITSPPYWRMRQYTDDPREIGQETTLAAYVAALADVCAACWRVLRDDGTLWINLGDAYANDGKWGGSTGGKHAGGLHGQSGPGRAKVSTGLPPKSLIGLPWRVAFALQDRGWVLRNEIIWHKTTCMPEGRLIDRFHRNHEPVFLFSKGARYFFDPDALAEPTMISDRTQYRRAIELAQEAGLTEEHFAAIRSVGLTDTGKNQQTQTGTGKNAPAVQALADEAKRVLGGYYREFLMAPTKGARTVWSIAPEPLDDDHYAPMPQELAERCIRAGSRPGDVVLDPFAGSGTTGRAALALQRSAVLIDLSYQELQGRRTDGVQVEMFV